MQSYVKSRKLLTGQVCYSKIRSSFAFSTLTNKLSIKADVPHFGGTCQQLHTLVGVQPTLDITNSCPGRAHSPDMNCTLALLSYHTGILGRMWVMEEMQGRIPLCFKIFCNFSGRSSVSQNPAVLPARELCFSREMTPTGVKNTLF